MVRITFIEQNAHENGPYLDVPVGTNLMAAILQSQRPVGSSCGAKGICAKCFIVILEGAENLSKPNPIEKKLVDREHLSSNVRISCQTKVFGPITVTTSYW